MGSTSSNSTNQMNSSTKFKTIHIQDLKKPKEARDYYCNYPFDFLGSLRERSEEDVPFGEILTTYSNAEPTETSQTFSSTTKNSFFDTFWIPYNTHSELILSPDDIWIAICLALSRHVNINAEKLRSHFVSHEGKKELVVHYPVLENPFSQGFKWDQILSGFENALAKNAKGEIIKSLVADFSTTGDIEKIVSQICIMDTMKKYFSYRCSTLCGITKVHFMGTLEDWQSILAKTQALRKYDCEFWIDQLTPILEAFIKAYKGKVDAKFWNDVFCQKETHGSGGTITFSGWILAFFPYRSDDSVLLTNHYSKLKIDIGDMPSYAAKVPFVLELADGSEFDMMFLAGFSNVLEDNDRYRMILQAGVAAADDGASEKIRQEMKNLDENIKEAAKN